MDLQFIPGDNALSGFTKAGSVQVFFLTAFRLKQAEKYKKKIKKMRGIKRARGRARTLLQGVGHEAASMDVSMAASLELKVAPAELWPANLVVRRGLSRRFKS